MKITSPEFENNSTIPEKYTCEGKNINPPLAFEELPEGSKSLALIMEDPDAPIGLWIHWVIWNIAPEIKIIDENSVPENAVVGKNTRGNNQYGGPCPPDREHRYFFKLYALDSTLDLSKDSSKDELETAMIGHIIEGAELIGRYNKKENQ